MTEFTLRLDDIVAEVIDADIANSIPRQSRNSKIVSVLAEHYREQIEKLQEQKNDKQPQSKRKAA